MTAARLAAGGLFGALAGAGGAVALIQAGWLESSTTSVVMSALSAGVFALITTALARYRVVRWLLSAVAIGLSVVTIVMAQSPNVDARTAQTTACVDVVVGGEVIPGRPGRGEMGSVTSPVRVHVDGADTLAVEIRTERRFGQVDLQASVVEPISSPRREFTSSQIDFENGRGVFDLEIVETSLGLGVEVDGSTIPLPFGTVRIEGVFSQPADRQTPTTCTFDLYFQVVSSAWDSLVGKIGLAALAVGSIGFVVVALTAGRAPGPVISARPPTPPGGGRPIAPRPPPPPASVPSTSAPPPPASVPRPPPPAPPGPPAPRPVPSAPSTAPPPPPSVPAGVGSPPATVGPPGSGPAVVSPPTAGGADPDEVIDLREDRFVQMRIEVDDFPEQGFLAGRTNVLSFWIGPRVDSAYVAGSSEAVPETGRTLHLDAHFEWPGGDAHGELTLPVDRSMRSEPKFTVAVDIDAAATRFAGTLYFWVRETGRLYEQVEVIGAAAAQPHESQPRMVSIVEDRGQIERITDTSLPMGGCLIHEGNTLSWYTGAEPATFDASGFSTVLDGLASAVANLQARSGTVDWTDPGAVDLLRRLAVEGAKLRYAIAGTIEPGRAFQFFNHQGKSSMPLEWIYDRGHTAPDAELRAACVASLRDASASTRSVDAPFPCGCPPAGALTPDVLFSNPVLCPWGFWGLAKIIERYDIEPQVRNNIVHPDDDQALPAISSVLLGANESLDRPSGRPGDEVIDLAGSLAGSVATDRVYTWAELRSKIAGGVSNLIVTLPHQDQDSLQIGTDRLLLSQVPALLPGHLDGIILLLGCKTSQPASTGFASFARLFKDKAAVVIGSSATLVTTDAARLAIGLVHGLLEISQTDQPLGQAIVDARRAMFADGLPIALAVNAIGDADWRFAVEHQPLVSA